MSPAAPSSAPRGPSESRSAGITAAGALWLACLLSFVVLKYLGTVNGWKRTHWLFSYELGFVKRGLLGSLAQLFAPQGVLSIEAIVVWSLLGAALFIALLAAFATPLFTRTSDAALLALASAALLSPGIGHLLADLGRFDVWNYALCLGVLVATRAWGRFPYPLFLAATALVLLIHEAGLLLCVPVLFVAYLFAKGRLAELDDPRRWPGLLALAAPLVLLFALLASFGRLDLGHGELIDRLAAQAQFRPNPISAFVLIRGLDSNWGQILGWEQTIPASPGQAAIPLGGVDLESFAMILPVALLAQALAHAVFATLPRERRRGVLSALHLCFLAPLPLLLVGVDWGRWVALGAANTALLTLLFARELRPRFPARPVALAALGLLVIVVSVGSGYRMQGARWGYAESPQMAFKRWQQDHERSGNWQRAFATP